MQGRTEGLQMSKAREQANTFLALCEKMGFVAEVDVECNSLRVSKMCEPNNKEKYCEIDHQATVLLANVPWTGGSVWGTTGVGFDWGMEHGIVSLHQSGKGGRRFLKALRDTLSCACQGKNQ